MEKTTRAETIATRLKSDEALIVQVQRPTLYPKNSPLYGYIGVDNIILVAPQRQLSFSEQKQKFTDLVSTLKPIKFTEPNFNEYNGNTTIGVMEFHEELGSISTDHKDTPTLTITNEVYRKLLREQGETSGSLVHGFGDSHVTRRTVIGRTTVYVCEDAHQLKVLASKDLPHVPAVLRMEEHYLSASEPFCISL